MQRSPRRGATLALAAGAALLATPGVAQAARPHLRLRAANTRVTLNVYRFPDGSTSADGTLGLWVEAVDGRVAIRASRASYDVPVTASARRGDRSFGMGAGLLAGWNGLSRFATATWHRHGKSAVAATTTVDWCPNGWDNARTGPDGPPLPTFPQQGCAGNPFSLGALWGLDRSWAASLPVAIPDIPLTDGARYDVAVRVRPLTGNALGFWHADRTVNLDVTLKVTDIVDVPGGKHAARSSRPSRGTPRSGTATTARRPGRTGKGAVPSDTLPDLRSLPAWGISTGTDDQGHDLLNFGATEWNAGPGPMVVEGFLQPGSSTVMDAYQGFYRKGAQVDFRKVGTIQYDSEDDGDWHFSAFAQYDLLNADGSLRQTSGKDSWCLAPTDAVDTLVRNAAMNPGNMDFGTRCGYAGAIWLREVLAVGWGDTYNQARLGQSFDITDIPNGTYKIRVTVNPDGTIVERTRDNDVSYRTVILGGTKGARTVKVPPVGLVDSEAGMGTGPTPGG